MIGHRSPISGVACFGDRHVATAGYDGQVILWDAATRVALARGRHDHLANHATFSPCGRYLVSGSSDYSVRLWRLPDLALQAVMQHDDDVERVAFSPDGLLVASASRDCQVRIFYQDGRLLHRLEGHQSDAVFVEFTDGGRELVSNSDDGDIRRWDVVSGRLLERVSFGGAQMDTITVGPSGVLFAGDDDGNILALRQGQVTAHQAHALGIKCLAFDARRSLLASTGYDGFLRTWRVDTDGTSTLESQSEAPPSVWLRCCAFDGRGRVVVGTFGSGYATFDPGSGDWDLQGVKDTPGLNAVAYVGGAVWSVGDAGVVRRDGVELARMGSLCNFLLGWQDRVLTGGQSGAVFDARTGAVLLRQSSPINCGVVVGDLAVLGTYSGTALVLAADPGGGVTLVRQLPLFRSAIKGLAARGGTLFATCADGSAVRVDGETLCVTEVIPEAHQDIVNGVAALGDGRFVTVGRDRVLRLWNGGSAESHPTPHEHSVRCVAASAGSSLVATGAYDGTVAVFDVEARRWTRTIRPSDFGISSLCADGVPGRFLASSYDGQVYEI